MKTFGSHIEFSTVNAPKPISGICEGYSYKDAQQFTEIPGEGEIAALVRHGRKGAITFSSTPPSSVTSLGVRAGGVISITGLGAGIVLVTTAGAKWQKGQPMVMDAQATHYPDVAGGGAGSIDPADFSLSSGTGALQLPTGKVWWSTAGIEPIVPGIVQSCSISETVQVQEEEGSGDDVGKIVCLAVHSYKATASMEIMTTAAMPEIGSALEVFGSFKVTDAEPKFTRGNSRVIVVNGICIPGVTE
jgi:hypothetical protein